MTVRPLALLAVVALVAAPLSGCSGGGSPAAGPGSNASEGLLVPGAVTIATLFGKPDYERPEESREKGLLVESLIAECMAEQGWEYVPVVYPDFYYGFPEEDELERRQREGYDVAQYEIVGLTGGTIDDPWADWVDPNAAYVESLSARDLTGEAWEGYFEAFDGGAFSNPESPSPYGSGCRGQAWEEVSEPPAESDLYSSEHAYEIEQMYLRVDEVFQRHVQDDPRVLELEATWSGCMHDAGYEFASNEDLWAYVWGSGFVSGSTFEPQAPADLGPGFSDRVWAILGDNYFEEAADGVFVLSDEQLEALEEVRADEIAMAVAALPCDLAYLSAFDEAYAVIEAEFVADQRDEIEAAVERAITDGLNWDWVVTDGL